MRSLYSGVSGLKAHQTAMDVIGNNISNVNTTGYKSSSITFQELFSQTLQGATAAQGDTGGSNAIQIGLGVSIGSITYNMESGSIESSSGILDVALDGDGFFIVSDGSQNYYTRSGSFSYDANGNITYGDGYYVQGWQADEDGTVNTDEQVGNISLDLSMDPSASTYIDFTGNISTTLENILDLDSSEIDVEDTNGDTDTISIELTEGDTYNTWKYTLTAGDSSSVFTIGGNTYIGSITGEIVLNNDGEITSFTTDGGDDLFSDSLTLSIGGTGPAVTIADHTGSTTIDTSTISLLEDSTTGESINVDYEFASTIKFTAQVYDSQGNSHTVYFYADQIADNTWEINSSDVELTDGSNVSLNSNTITLVFDDDGNLVSGDELELSFTPDGLSNTQTVSVDLSGLTQNAGDTDLTAAYDGYTAGSLEDISFSDTGELVGSYSNGYSKTIAQLGIGDFTNSSGLLKVGDTLFQESVNSGDVMISTAGSGGTGSVAGSSLEASNVDLSEQFSEMIKIQRGYQANSTVITTSDEMLETLVNMKR